MNDLPYDVWLHIGSFLTKDQLWHLRFLNRAMYDVAMDTSHKNVVVSLSDYSPSKEYRRDFLRFRDQAVMRRVREISFKYYHYEPTHDYLEPKNTPRNAPKRGFKERSQNFLKGKDDKTLVVETIAGFTRVRTLKVEYIDLWQKVLQDSIPLLHTAILSSSASLQSISFSFPFENLAAILPSSLSLPRLTSFSMTIFGLEKTDRSQIDGLFPNAAQTIIVPFINRHRFTLKSLCLRLRQPRLYWSPVAPDIPTNFDITPMYQGLERIPHLRSLGLSASRATDRGLITRFLDMHAETVRNLSIYMMDPTFQTTDVVFEGVKSHFHDLDSLIIESLDATQNTNTPFPQDLGSTRNFVINHSPSLTSLRMSGKPLSRDAVFAFLSPQAQSSLPGSYAKLGYMNLTLQSLTPELFTLFESSLSNLEDLELSVRKFKRRHRSPESMNEEYEFCLAMGRQDFSHWKLISLVLSVKNHRHNEYTTAEKSYGTVAVAGALTSLQTFNGVPRCQYLSEARNSVAGLPKAQALTQQTSLFPWD